MKRLYLRGIASRLFVCPACGCIFAINPHETDRDKLLDNGKEKIACNHCGHTALMKSFGRKMDRETKSNKADFDRIIFDEANQE